MTKEDRALFFYSIKFYKELKNLEPDRLLKIAEECKKVIYPPDTLINKKVKITSYNAYQKLTNVQVMALFITSIYIYCKKLNVEPTPIIEEFPFIKDVEKYASLF